jgi:urea transport system permease protein
MRILRLAPLLCLFILGASLPGLSQSGENLLAPGLEALSAKSFRTKAKAVALIAESGDPRARSLLMSLAEGRVYLRKADGLLVVATPSDGAFDLSDASTGASLEPMEKSSLKKIIINNKMRKSLRTEIARMSLRAPKASERREAVRSLFASMSGSSVEVFERALLDEDNRSVQKELRVAIGLAYLESEDPEERLDAVRAVSASMHPEARNRLEALLVQGHALDQESRAAATAAVDSIDAKRRFFGFVETAFFGLNLGFILVLAAIGLAITFGVMGVINMAHGELMMIGAYTTWGVQQLMPNHLELSLFAAIPAAFVISGSVGIAIERGVVRFLYGRPLETLLATFGVSLVLQQMVRTIISPLNRAVVTPQWMSGQLVINDALALNYNRIYIVLFSIAVFLGLAAVLRFTTLGLQVRAVSQNRDMARAMGVRGGRIDAITFGLGSGVAGLAGVALSQLTNVGPNLGQSHIVDSFMVVVFGGVGNLWGTLVAGLSLGMANKLMEPFVGAVLAKILVLIFIILFIQRRPRGLFPQRGRAAEA